LFRDFKEKLVQEYGQLRDTYIQEFEQHYHNNYNERTATLNEI